MAMEQGQNTGKQAPSLRKTLLKSLPPLPKPAAAPGVTFSHFSLILGGAIVVAALGWAFFMGFMVGRGENPKEQVAEATSFLRDNGRDKAADIMQAGEQSTQAGTSAIPATATPLGTEQGSGQIPAQTSAQTTAQVAPVAPAAPQQAGAPAQQGAPVFDPHARPKGDSLAAWDRQNQVPAAPQRKTSVQEGKPAKAGAGAATPAKAKPAPAASGPKYAFTYQLGAYKNRAAAEAMQKKVAAKGQRCAVSQSGKVWLVTFQVRGTEDQARNTRLKLEQQGLGKAMLLSRKAL